MVRTLTKAKADRGSSKATASRTRSTIAFDTETTGVDLYHGVRPFFVTLCYDAHQPPLFWEWDVDPLTRQVAIPQEDIAEIRGWLDQADEVVLHNAKFDATVCREAGITPGQTWPWHKTRCTLALGHLLASNLPHDLTSMGIHYLGIDIQQHEDKLEQAVKEARNYCRTHLPEWRIAKEDDPLVPSAAEKKWKYDTWLPRALVKHLTQEEGERKYRDHPWWTVLAEYANIDSEATRALWAVLRDECKGRGLWAIYEERMRLLPVVNKVELTGITANAERLHQMKQDFATKREEADARCIYIADSYGYKLSLPKSGNNNSLKWFCFGEPADKKDPQSPRTPYLDLPVVGYTDTGQPSLDKYCMDEYLATLPANSKQATFVRSLQESRKRGTSLTYMEGYERFWLPTEMAGFYLLHPNLNPFATDTLRFSSNNPNSQNISKQEDYNLRYLFGPAPGREWWSLDAKNIEARLPAYLSGEKLLIDLYERPNDPPYYGSGHLLNFHTVYPDIWEAELKRVGLEKVGATCKKKYAATWYQWCKNGGFAVQYGAIDRVNGTADKAFHRVGSHARIKARLSKLEALNQQCIRQANDLGYVETIPDRSVDGSRGYPLLCARTRWGGVLPTVPLNYKIQGSAMWWTCRAMIRCQGQLDQWNRPLPRPDYFMVMQVHDELVFDFPRCGNPVADYEYERKHGKLPRFRTSNLWRIRILQKLMEQGGKDFVPSIPTPVGCEYHTETWAEGITL